MSTSLGLKFKKFDLHIHTPASYDYKNRTILPEDIVREAISKGLAGIAITDHNTANLIDNIKEKVKGKKLVIFPGVEVLATGGERGVHITILFDVDKNSEYINQFLHAIGIHKKSSTETTIADKSVDQIAGILESYDSNAIMILAHCHSSKGVLGDIKGDTREIIFENKKKCILGAEANESDFLDENKKKNHKRVIDCLDGSDQNYHYSKLGVFQSSDAHNIEEIGKSYTYFKVDFPTTIEDIRQSLIDRDTRIRQSFEYQDQIYPKINSLKITSGFLKDQEFKFHEGLNSILGAKGSGKSLAIEFLRFVLNRPPKDKDLLTDHNSKLEKCLKLRGEVIISITDESGKEYIIKRIYDPDNNNPIEIIDPLDNSIKKFDIEKTFQLLFLSQNEVIKIAEDKTGKRQREFIDNFFNFFQYQQRIDNLNKQLQEIDEQLADVLKAYLISQDITKRIDTFKEEVNKINRQIKNTVFTKYSEEEKIGHAIKSQENFINQLEESISEKKDELSILTIPTSEDDEILENPIYKRVNDITRKASDEVIEGMENLIIKIKSYKSKIITEYNEWFRSFESLKSKYEELVKKAGGNQAALNQKRNKFLNDKNQLEKDLIKYENRSKQIQAISKKRINILDDLKLAYNDYYKERKNRCDYFTKCSNSSLLVSIKEQEDTSAFKNNLLKFKRGSWLKDLEIELISRKVSPRDFIGKILNYEFSQRKKKEYIKELSDITNINFYNMEKLIDYLLESYEYTDILSLIYSSTPEDVPSIKFRVENNYKELSELSVGQKAIALLIIALSDGNFPIIIDQPEDSLDLRSIWEDVCEKLRGTKDKRQFIFTTHNSSVAVASDSDKFTILEAGATLGKVIHTGSINRREIKKEIIDYLEGGKDTYNKKRDKYNI